MSKNEGSTTFIDVAEQVAINIGDFKIADGISECGFLCELIKPVIVNIFARLESFTTFRAW